MRFFCKISLLFCLVSISANCYWAISGHWIILVSPCFFNFTSLVLVRLFSTSQPWAVWRKASDHSSVTSISFEVHTISFQTFFVWALLLIVHTWKSSPLRSNILRLQCICTIPTTSGRPHGSPLVWACQWPSAQLISSPQLSHRYSLWA